MFHVPEKLRVRKGMMGSDESAGNNGAFILQTKKAVLKTIVSDQMGWEHVSVSLGDRCPTWDEMCQVKALFWDKDDCVVQYHPSESDYVNNHPYCLHLWRPVSGGVRIPPSILVGHAGMSAADAKRIAEGMK
jgi:hypothetical protein